MINIRKDSATQSNLKSFLGLLLAAGALFYPANPETWRYRYKIKESQNSLAFDSKEDPESPNSKHVVQKGKLDSLQEASKTKFKVTETEQTTSSRSQAQRKSNHEQRRQATAYSVIHNHVIGSCRGKLILSGETIVYEPEEDSKDGFQANLVEVTGDKMGDTLKIRFKDKTYRFRSDLHRSKQNSKNELNALYRIITKIKKA